jgi:hypothetical protein
MPLLGLGLFLGVVEDPLSSEGSPSLQRWIGLLLGISGVLLASLVLPGSLTKALHARVCWDRGRGLMVQGRLWARRRRPLADILAVQVLQAVGASRRVPADQTCPYYQVNLVFNDPDRSRLNLTNHIDRRWAGQAGGKIADFLGVPHVVQTAGEAPAPASATTLPVGQRTIPLDAAFLTSWPLCPPSLLDGEQPTLVADSRKLQVCGPSFWRKGRTNIVFSVWFRLGSLVCILVFLRWVGSLAFAVGRGLVRDTPHLSVLDWAGWSVLILLGAEVLFLILRYIVYRGLFSYRVIFDRLAGLMRVRGKLFWHTRPLSDIVGVQLLGEADYALSAGGIDGPQHVGVVSRSYQVNLVLDDLAEPRLHLLLGGDLAWARQNGKQLADFLGVPFVEQLPG